MGGNAELPPAKVPGVVIDYNPAKTRTYIGSPSIAILPNGDYVASHDFFGPGSSNNSSVVFGSSDHGAHWRKRAELDGQWWSSLFVHRSALYILGTTKEYGDIVIRRSEDGGCTWSAPVLLRDDGQYHCAPVPVLLHDGRLWRAFERRNPPLAWGTNFCAGVLSAPADADLLKPANWTASNFLHGDTAWIGDTFGGWLEGNAVVTRDGKLLDVLRVDIPRCPEKVALVSISRDGCTASFDPQAGFVDFPGGAKKFTIRYDKQSLLYWSLASVVPERHQGDFRPAIIRNTLALMASPDLKNWTIRCHLLYHPDPRRHGFQYLDWQFEGNDIIAVCRTAYDDDNGGAQNFHNANYLTFHRIANFQTLTMDESVPFTVFPQVHVEVADFSLTGHGWGLAQLADGKLAFANRQYVWGNVPVSFRDWRFTQLRGGERAELFVKAKRDTTLFIATTPSTKLAGWKAVPDTTFYYTKRQTKMMIYSHAMKAGEELRFPQNNWAGSMAVLPPETRP